ncbi:MAG: DUF6431 domain-containing protein [Streptococcaceae bacterium]|nr:DUF6431 domain-containing protein [Streptococcaceae bacterium]
MQKCYDKFVDSLECVQLKCSNSDCGVSGQIIKHAYYRRNVKLGSGKTILKVLRVICKKCETTHAILPDWLVPYSQVLLEDHLEILQNYVKGNTPNTTKPSNPEVDVRTAYYIIKDYRDNWQENLRSISTSVFIGKKELILKCFSEYKFQFMQIKKTKNSLFLSTT